MAGYFLVLLLSKWFELVSATTQEAAFIFTWATCDIEHPIVLLQKQQFGKQKPVLPLKNEVNCHRVHKIYAIETVKPIQGCALICASWSISP